MPTDHYLTFLSTIQSQMKVLTAKAEESARLLNFSSLPYINNSLNTDDFQLISTITTINDYESRIHYPLHLLAA